MRSLPKVGRYLEATERAKRFLGCYALSHVQVQNLGLTPTLSLEETRAVFDISSVRDEANLANELCQLSSRN